MIVGLEVTTTPTLICMVGFPGSGKSYLANRLAESVPNIPVLSTDDYVEARAKELGLKYDDVWSEYINEATKSMNVTMQALIKSRLSFIVDRTNLSAKRRKGMLSHLPKEYQSIAIYVQEPPKDLWLARLNNRPGKHITMSMVDNMRDYASKPTLDEGWTAIIAEESV